MAPAAALSDSAIERGELYGVVEGNHGKNVRLHIAKSYELVGENEHGLVYRRSHRVQTFRLHSGGTFALRLLGCLANEPPGPFDDAYCGNHFVYSVWATDKGKTCTTIWHFTMYAGERFSMDAKTNELRKEAGLPPYLVCK